MPMISSDKNSGFCLTATRWLWNAESSLSHISFRITHMDDNTPVTKADITRLETIISEFASSMDGKLMHFNEEIKRHFDVIAEDLRHDVMGANRDEVLSIQDRQADHLTRIKRLEHCAGILS